VTVAGWRGHRLVFVSVWQAGGRPLRRVWARALQRGCWDATRPVRRRRRRRRCAACPCPLCAGFSLVCFGPFLCRSCSRVARGGVSASCGALLVGGTACRRRRPGCGMALAGGQRPGVEATLGIQGRGMAVSAVSLMWCCSRNPESSSCARGTHKPARAQKGQRHHGRRAKSAAPRSPAHAAPQRAPPRALHLGSLGKDGGLHRRQVPAEDLLPRRGEAGGARGGARPLRAGKPGRGSAIALQALTAAAPAAVLPHRGPRDLGRDCLRHHDVWHTGQGPRAQVGISPAAAPPRGSGARRPAGSRPWARSARSAGCRAEHGLGAAGVAPDSQRARPRRAGATARPAPRSLVTPTGTSSAG
jgi:hypothetical protein